DRAVAVVQPAADELAVLVHAIDHGAGLGDQRARPDRLAIHPGMAGADPVRHVRGQPHGILADDRQTARGAAAGGLGANARWAAGPGPRGDPHRTTGSARHCHSAALWRTWRGSPSRLFAKLSPFAGSAAMAVAAPPGSGPPGPHSRGSARFADRRGASVA